MSDGRPECVRSVAKKRTVRLASPRAAQKQAVTWAASTICVAAPVPTRKRDVSGLNYSSWQMYLVTKTTGKRVRTALRRVAAFEEDEVAAVSRRQSGAAAVWPGSDERSGRSSRKEVRTNQSAQQPTDFILPTLDERGT